MLRILAIGNSFSTDAMYYLHDILESAGVANRAVNLYIGGCPLERHWANMEQNARDYQYQLNGRNTDRMVSIETILQEEAFDVIITQQSSGNSGWEASYEPFLGLMTRELRSRTQAKLFLNETWAYETGSNHPQFMRYSRSQQEMFTRLQSAYQQAAARHDLPLIETGEVIQKLRELPYFSDGQRTITRDGFHLSFLYGRYAAALSWARRLAGIDAEKNAFVPAVDFMPCEAADPEILAAIKRVVNQTIRG